MLTLNTSQPVRLVSANEQIQSQGVNLPPSSSTQTIATWINYINKYLYVMQAMPASPWLRCDRYTYTATGEIGSKVAMTLS